MQKFVVLTIIFVFLLISQSNALQITDTSTNHIITKQCIQKQVERINKSSLEYVKKIIIKDTANYTIPNRMILADANTDYTITIYQNNISDNQVYEVLLHEIGHCVYWKTNQHYYDIERWSDYFRTISKFDNIYSVNGIIRCLNRWLNWTLEV